ncbi:MAG: glycosyl transferase [Desulfobacterales bacterium]|nr:glycosyl transferase [Desulfobacterales bacterium]
MLYLSPLLSFILCVCLTPIVSYIAKKKKWMAYPSEERWHKQPTALLGGIAIYLSIVIPLLFNINFSDLSINGFFEKSSRLEASFIYFSSIIGISFLFILGLIDDFIRIKPQTKLVGQILTASFISFIGFRLHWFTSLTVDTIITIVWIVGITNSFNLLDNMDGLCAGIGGIASMYLSILLLGDLNIALIGMIILGALLGFLVYNFNPASIFMGDCGSLSIGFSLSILGLLYAEIGSKNALSYYAIYVVPIMVLAVPIFDTTMVTCIRILSGRKASVGGKDHTSHRLVVMGLSEKGAVIFLYGIASISGLSALFVHKNDSFTSPVIIIPLIISILLMGIYLSQIRLYPEKEFSMLRDKSFTPILIQVAYKRQLIFVMLDFCIISFAYYLSYRLRFEDYQFGENFKIFLNSLPVIIACKLITFFLMGVYRGIWRFLSVNDIFVYIKASIFASLLSVAILSLLFSIDNFVKSIFIIDLFLSTSFILGARWSFRFFVDTMKRKTLEGKNILIYGAGMGGEIFLREILNNNKLKVVPIGFIDDNFLKAGKKILGYPVIGSFQDIQQSMELKICKDQISGLIISFNITDFKSLEQIKKFCRENDLFLKKFSIHLEELDLV